MNKFIGMGRLTRDPELRTTNNSIAVCNFTIAINRRFINKETNSYDADFLNCTAWRGTGEFISKYFRKGNMIAVVGSVQTRKYDDKEGKPRTATDVIVDEAYFCGSKSDNSAQAAQTAPAPDAGFFPGPDDDTSLPFDI